MNLTLQELNEIYYCLHVALNYQSKHPFIKIDSVSKISDKISDEIGRLVMDEVNEEINELKLTGKL